MTRWRGPKGKMRYISIMIIAVVLVVVFLAFEYPGFIGNDKQFSISMDNSYSNYTDNFTSFIPVPNGSLVLNSTVGETLMNTSNGYNSSLKLTTSGFLFYVYGPNFTQVDFYIQLNGHIVGGLTPKSLTFRMQASGTPGNDQVLFFMWYPSQIATNLSPITGSFEDSGFGSANATMSLENQSNSLPAYDFSYSVEITAKFNPTLSSTHSFLIEAILGGLSKTVYTFDRYSFTET